MRTGTSVSLVQSGPPRRHMRYLGVGRGLRAMAFDWQLDRNEEDVPPIHSPIALDLHLTASLIPRSRLPVVDKAPGSARSAPVLAWASPRNRLRPERPQPSGERQVLPWDLPRSHYLLRGRHRWTRRSCAPCTQPCLRCVRTASGLGSPYPIRGRYGPNPVQNRHCGASGG